MDKYVKGGRFDRLRDSLQQRPSSLPNWTQEEQEHLEEHYLGAPHLVDSIIASALQVEEYMQCLEKKAIMKRLSIHDRVAYVWLKAEHLAAHEKSILRCPEAVSGLSMPSPACFSADHLCLGLRGTRRTPATTLRIRRYCHGICRRLPYESGLRGLPSKGRLVAARATRAPRPDSEDSRKR